MLNRISRQLASSRRMRVAYGNPRLLRAVSSLYAGRFVPFAESIVIKAPHCGAPFDWHQDGQFKTGWAPERGVNFGIYLHGSGEGNGCLHAIPGSHRTRVDVPALVSRHGPRLPGSIPAAAGPDDAVFGAPALTV